MPFFLTYRFLGACHLAVCILRLPDEGSRRTATSAVIEKKCACTRRGCGLPASLGDRPGHLCPCQNFLYVPAIALSTLPV